MAYVGIGSVRKGPLCPYPVAATAVQALLQAEREALQF